MAAAAHRRQSDRSLTAHRSRLARLKRHVSARQLDALLITNPPDIRYLTGFHGEASWLIVGRGKPVVISDFRLAEDLEPMRPLVQVVIRSGQSMVEAVREVVTVAKVRKLGVPRAHLTLDEYAQLVEALGAKRLAATGGLTASLRERKDAGEVALLRKAIRIQEQALLAVLPTIEPGQTESEVCALLEYEMKALGADGPSFETIVAAGANSSKPHARPTSAKLRAGQLLLIDWGAKVQGYHGDLTRTFAIQRWPGKFEEIYEIVLEAQLAAIDAIRPGVLTSDVDAVARTIIAKAGYGDQFGHSLGHGIGLNIHEGPRLAKATTAARPQELEPGMVVTVEPGIYLPGAGGIRIEDDVLVTARGRRVLSSLPTDKKWAKLA
jgi:Xaa-Pro aminopeptidase